MWLHRFFQPGNHGPHSTSACYHCTSHTAAAFWKATHYPLESILSSKCISADYIRINAAVFVCLYYWFTLVYSTIFLLSANCLAAAIRVLCIGGLGSFNYAFILIKDLMKEFTCPGWVIIGASMRLEWFSLEVPCPPWGSSTTNPKLLSTTTALTSLPCVSVGHSLVHRSSASNGLMLLNVPRFSSVLACLRGHVFPELFSPHHVF